MIQDKLETRIKLSLLWILIMFNMAFADILSFYIPDKQAELEKYVGDTAIHQFMLVAAIILEMPILMIFLSRILEYKINRWLNIIVGILMIFFIIGPEIGNDSINPHYLFLGMVEVVLLVFIIWTASKWATW